MGIIKSTEKKEYQNTSSKQGLTEKEAQKNYEKYGPNILCEKKKRSSFKILIGQFSDFMVLVLIGATIISALMGETIEAITIIGIVLVNAILGFIQEYRTEKTMEALKNLSAPTAKVIRDGQLKNIKAIDIVPGDLVEIEAGDRIPADATIVEGTSLSVDESLLTGESIPVEKTPSKYSSNGNFERSDQNEESTQRETQGKVFMGTMVRAGRGKIIVRNTGMSTEMGSIANMIQEIEDEETPLQRKLDGLGKIIAYGCFVICGIVALTGIIRGENIFNMLLAGISLAVAAVPEGLPAIVTIALALGVQRMLKRKSLIRKLPAVETLGCASVICSDKTGTLTENKMAVRKIYVDKRLVDVTGEAYSEEGEFLLQNKKISPSNIESLKLALEIGGLCNNSKIKKAKKSNDTLYRKMKSVVNNKSTLVVNGDPTEGALRIALTKSRISSDELEKRYKRIDEIPFDSDRKLMSVVCENNTGNRVIYTKGAPDVVIKKCNKIHTSNGIVEITPSIRADIMRNNDQMASSALRVIGVAYKDIDKRSYNKNTMENDLIFVGLMGMIDPPRKEAFEAVRKCKLAGIKTVMITGDHKKTATTIAKELKILSEGDKVITGEEIELMGEDGLERQVEDATVYARVSPKHKLMIVKALKKKGHVVAMTGDGVNDAPAVKEADIGVAMGITGTDVTKEASSMILLDDNFATIVSAVEEGRVIYNNIRKFIRYMLSCNIGEVITMFVAALIGLPIPLMPIQILWVNLVTDGLPAIALGLESAEKDIMMKPPRGSNENIFSNGLFNLILFRGILIGFSTLAVFTTLLWLGNSVEVARTGAFLTLVLTQLIHVFECKSESKTIFQISLTSNMALVFAAMISACMILSAIYIPILQKVFNTVSLGLEQWIVVSIFSSIGPLTAGICRTKRANSRNKRRL